MSLYRVRYTPRADRDLSKLTPEIAQKVVSTIHDIRESPYLYIKKMKASNPLHPIYSLRVHRDIRALLSIHDDVLVIHVLEVEHRKHSYRDF
jgi:mRNA interferase RelE/StbE